MNITVDEAIALLREAVIGREDYVYMHPDETPDVTDVGCAYTHGDQPGCLIGVALHIAGVPIEVLAALNHNHISSMDVLDDLLEAGFALDNHAVHVFMCAQLAQDDREPWKVALHRAEDVYKTLTTEATA